MSYGQNYYLWCSLKLKCFVRDNLKYQYLAKNIQDLMVDNKRNLKYVKDSLLEQGLLYLDSRGKSIL